MCSIGLQGALAPLNIITALDPEPILTAGNDWSDLEFEVALDSGAVVHVCSLDDCPGYLLQDSPGSLRGQEFLMGDGGTIKNLGQKSLNLTDVAADRDLVSTFQIAAVTRPLMSVGKICDEGHNITFDSIKPVVRNKHGAELCQFDCQPGGLYVPRMKLRNPDSGFTRSECSVRAQLARRP